MQKFRLNAQKQVSQMVRGEFVNMPFEETTFSIDQYATEIHIALFQFTHKTYSSLHCTIYTQRELISNMYVFTALFLYIKEAEIHNALP